MKLIKISELNQITKSELDYNDELVITDVSSDNKLSKKITIGQLKEYINNENNYGISINEINDELDVHRLSNNTINIIDYKKGVLLSSNINNNVKNLLDIIQKEPIGRVYVKESKGGKSYQFLSQGSSSDDERNKLIKELDDPENYDGSGYSTPSGGNNIADAAEDYADEPSDYETELADKRTARRLANHIRDGGRVQRRNHKDQLITKISRLDEETTSLAIQLENNYYLDLINNKLINISIIPINASDEELNIYPSLGGNKNLPDLIYDSSDTFLLNNYDLLNYKEIRRYFIDDPDSLIGKSLKSVIKLTKYKYSDNYKGY